MKEKKHLSFKSLIHGFRKHTDAITDPRKGESDFSLTDIILSAFACMYFQSPSLLRFQKDMEEGDNLSNLTTLFEVQKVPEATQLRNILDQIKSEDLSSLFKELFARLQRGKHLEQYQFYKGSYLISLDGTQYYSSTKVSCEHCLSKKHRNGEVSFSHQALQAALVNPDIKQVIPILAENISNQDGQKKQDCEISAGKRATIKLRAEHPQLDMTLLADSLYSKQPMIEHVVENRFNYIFGAKPGDHKTLFQYLERSSELEEYILPAIRNAGCIF